MGKALRLPLFAAALLAVSAPPVASGPSDRPGEVQTPPPAPLVLFLAPGLSLGDLMGPRLPHLAALARESAAGWMNVTTRPGRTDLASACLTLGAGLRVAAPPGPPIAITAPRLIEPARTRLWRTPDGAERSPDQFTRRRSQASADREAPYGRLGELLAAGGRRVGAVIAGDPSGGGELFLAVMDARGAIPAGIVGGPLLRQAPERPEGIAADRAAMAREAERLLGTCDVVAIDPGDLERARRYAPLCTPARAGEHARAALQDLDDLIGALRPVAREHGGTMMLLSPVAPADGSAPFGMLLAAGWAWPPGWLASGSTRIAGLITNTDFLPSVLDVSGARPTPLSVPGRPFASTGAGRLDDLRRLAADSARAEAVRGPAWTVLRAGLLLLLGCAAVPRGRGRLARRLLPAPMLLILVLLLAGDLAAPPSPERGTAHALLGLAALAAALRYWMRGPECCPPAEREAIRPANRADPDPTQHGARGARRAARSGTETALPSPAACCVPRAARCLLALYGVTVLLLLGELVTGGHLLRWSPLGYSLALGARYYGIGNEALGVLLGAALLLPFATVAALPRWRRAAAWGGALLYGLTLVLVGSPAVGADFGGALAAAVAFGLALPALAGRRPSARYALATLAGLLVTTALFAAWDAGRPPAAQTHLGRLVTAARATGLAPLVTTITGKALTAGRLALGLWGALALGETVVGWILLRRATPACPLRAGLALLLPAAAALVLFNDSGVIAAALALAPLPIAAAALAGPDDRQDHPAERPGFRQNPE